MPVHLFQPAKETHSFWEVRQQCRAIWKMNSSRRSLTQFQVGARFPLSAFPSLLGAWRSLGGLRQPVLALAATGDQHFASEGMGLRPPLPLCFPCLCRRFGPMQGARTIQREERTRKACYSCSSCGDWRRELHVLCKVLSAFGVDSEAAQSASEWGYPTIAAVCQSVRPWTVDRSGCQWWKEFAADGPVYKNWHRPQKP